MVSDLNYSSLSLLSLPHNAPPAFFPWFSPECTSCQAFVCLGTLLCGAGECIGPTVTPPGRMIVCIALNPCSELKPSSPTHLSFLLFFSLLQICLFSTLVTALSFHTKEALNYMLLKKTAIDLEENHVTTSGPERAIISYNFRQYLKEYWYFRIHNLMITTLNYVSKSWILGMKL